MVIVLEGSDGTGKTTLAQALKQRLNAAGYIHLTYQTEVDEYTYNFTAFNKALELAKKSHAPVIIDRWWLSETVYSEVFRGGTKFPHLGDFLDNIHQKAGGCTIFCLHDGTLRDYAAHFEMVKKQRPEMYKNTVEVAELYKQLWEGTYPYKPTNFATRVSAAGGFCRRDSCFKYTIGTDGKDMDSFCGRIGEFIYNKNPRE
jgi:uncharacterized protein (DUF952 family)